MKHTYRSSRLIAAIFCAIAFSFPAAAQTASELVVQTPAVTTKNFDQVKLQLVGLPGLTYSGYCNSEKFFLLKIDRNIQPDNTAIEGVFKNLQMDFYVKDGGFMAAMANCKDPQQAPGTPADQH